MRMFKYEALSEIAYDAIRDLTVSGQMFGVEAQGSTADRIQKFLANERRFHSSAKTFVDRMAYWLGGVHAIRLPNFIPLWNRALMDGYAVAAEVRNGSLLVMFTKRSVRDNLLARH